MKEELTADASPRLESVDLVRGLVMCLMAFDHCRDFFYYGGMENGINPLDPSGSHFLLYLSRWITHTCAPSFVFLAGLSVFFQKSGRRKAGSISQTLFLRGLWLILLELTLINLSWTFRPFFERVFLQVIWALGAGFIFMSLLHRLTPWAALAAGSLIVFLHNSLDAFQLHGEGWTGILWALAHERGFAHLPGGGEMYVPYPFLPWLGIMLCGYGAGPFFSSAIPEKRRQKGILITGFTLFFGFLLLRWLNHYGDPGPWSAAPGSREFWYQFFDVEKYPPSLLFSLITLSFLAFYLWLAGKRWLPFLQSLRTFGRVPFFFYFIHVPLIHSLAMLAFRIWNLSPEKARPDNGFGLPACIFTWLLVLLLLLWPCRWFEKVKAANRGKWWTAYS